ncbi:MAG: TlpA family protein disulfide reductase [Paludibacteraceae bacterium]
MKNKIVSFLIIFLHVNLIFSQSAIIIYKTDKDAKVRIYKPIDGQYNPFFISDVINLKSNKPEMCRIDVNQFCTVKSEFSNSSLSFINIMLLEGDTIEISNINNVIRYNGKNAKGNEYLAKNSIGLLDEKIYRFLNNNLTDKFDSEGFFSYINDSIIKKYKSDIIDLKNGNDISPEFAEIMEKSLFNALGFAQFIQLRHLLSGKIKHYNPTRGDSINIIQKLDSIFYVVGGQDINSMKYYYRLPFGEYCFFKYQNLNNTEKENLLKGYDEETFGEYKRYLLAPSDVLYPLIANQFIFDLQNQYNYYDVNKMLTFLSQKSPNSEYIPIIHQLLTKQNQKKGESEKKDIVIIENENISSLKDLMQIDEFKGKFAFIDLWATYCSPCKIQFQYNEELNKIFMPHSNLVKIYMSIDEEKDYYKWRSQIKFYNLTGYNLRASKKLIEYIEKRVFVNDLFSVPRYFIIDPDGKVLNPNLPRPQFTNDLKLEIEKILDNDSQLPDTYDIEDLSYFLLELDIQ